jgi:CBS domain-containing protein
MTALSELLDKPIRDPNGDEVARMHDLVVHVPASDGESGAAEPYPPVIGLVARLAARPGPRDVFIPWEKVRQMGTGGADLATPALNLQRFARRDGELVLREALLDRQVVDVEGRRVVRINDLEVAESAGVWRLVAVDVSAAAVVRRLGAGLLQQRVAALLGREAGAHAPLIDWAQVIPVAEGGTLRLRVPRERLDLLHPSDLARVVEQLTPQQGAELLRELDDARAADTLEELEDEQQAHVLRAMDPERAADVLEEMEPDEATDALQSFSREEAADLLERMDPEEASEVEELLGYPEDSAGGLMTTEYVAVPAWANAGGVIAALRARARAAARDEADPLPAALPEIYIVATGEGEHAFDPRPASEAVPLNAEGRLIGTLVLPDLLLAYPETRLVDIMRHDPPMANPAETARDAARVIAEDDLVALPVVDDEGHMLGIVTVDDAIDVILPTAWKKRLPRRFR